MNDIAYASWIRQCGDLNTRCEYDFGNPNPDQAEWSAYIRQCESGDNWRRPIGYCDRHPNDHYCQL